jgi:four helix bundle protein
MENYQIKQDPLREKTLDFAVRVVKLSQYLVAKKNEYIISKQIVRCGTNPGAMVREAANAESAMDFIHKLAIGQKELSETQYWLELLLKTDYISQTEYKSLHEDSTEIMRIIRSSILTKKKNLAKKIIPSIILIAGIFSSIFYFIK